MWNSKKMLVQHLTVNLGSLTASVTSFTGTGGTRTVETTGNQSYTGAVTLSQNLVTNSGSNDTTFGSTLNSADATDRNLTATGDDIFLTGAVGGTFDLGTVTINGKATIGPGVTTSGTQDYNGSSINFNEDSTLEGSTVTLNGPVFSQASEFNRFNN